MKRMFDLMQEVVTAVIIFWGGIILPFVATLAWLNYGWPTTTRDWLVAVVAASLTLFAWGLVFCEYHRWGDQDRLFWRMAQFVASLFTGWGDAIRELKARGWYNPGPEPRVETRVRSSRTRWCGKCKCGLKREDAACWPSDGPAICHTCYYYGERYGKTHCRTVGCNAPVAVDPLGIDCILYCEECWKRATEVARDAWAASIDAKEHGLFGLAAFHEQRLAEAQAVIQSCGDRHWSPLCEQCGWRAGNPDRCQHCGHQ
jgi:hypothetical protein